MPINKTAGGNKGANADRDGRRAGGINKDGGTDNNHDGCAIKAQLPAAAHHLPGCRARHRPPYQSYLLNVAGAAISLPLRLSV